MNYLALCKRLRSESGISGTGPAATAGQTGEMLRVVNWIDAAYEDIQNAYPNWRFLRSDFSFSTIAATQEYTPAAVSLTDHANWIIRDIRVYSSESDEQFLNDLYWDDFKIAYMYGSNRSLSTRPIAITERPSNKALVLFPIPDDVYTIVGEYYKTPDVLSGDTDTPIFPTRFHLAIVWKALMLYGAYTAADEKYAHGQNEFDKLMRALEHDQLDQIDYGEPLA